MSRFKDIAKNRLSAMVSFAVRAGLCAALLSVPAVSAIAQPADSSRTVPVDTAKVLGPDSLATFSQDSLPKISAPDSNSVQSKVETDSASPDSSRPRKKVVLHLGGGSYSPWYSLGVLYALRDYAVPVDSVVATSWGAFVGSLWSSGWPLDDIQRFLTDSSAVSQILGQEKSGPALDLPIANSGEPALAFRFSFFGDSSGDAHFERKKLDPDTISAKRALFRLKLQEALLRADPAAVVPFTALACREGRLAPASPYSSLPFSPTAGEHCPVLLSADTSVFSIYAIAYPVRAGAFSDSPSVVAGFEFELASLSALSGENPDSPVLVIRPHSFADRTPLTLMQTGYSDLERKLGVLSPFVSKGRQVVAPRDSILPRFRIDPSFDRLPAAYYLNASSYWNVSDTGLAAPENFLRRISESPFYDSVEMTMDTLGIANVLAEATPLLEFRVGGFGSNITGPLAFAAADFRYVDQFEYAFGIEGYAGEHSYSLRPEFRIRGMFEDRGGFSISGTFSKEEPLKSYFSDLDADLQVRRLNRSDLKIAFDYRDSLGDFSASVLVGEERFRTANEDDYGTLRVNSLIPKISFVRNRGGFEEWFGDKGYRIRADLGLRSVNLTYDGTGSAPLYLSSTMDLQKEFSPLRFVALGIGAAGGVNIRRETGYGYEYPDALSIRQNEPDKAIDCWYRLHPELSPWSSAWNFAESSSHHYALVRGDAGLRYGMIGLWLFCAYMRDFEENPYVDLSANRLLLEPVFRLKYRSVDIRAGLSRLVSAGDYGSLGDFKDYGYFFQVGAAW